MKLLWPLKGIGSKPGVYFTQFFGETKRDYSRFGYLTHNGIDIAAPFGTEVFASHAGALEFGNHPDGYGIFARLTHPSGYSTVYGHLHRTIGQPRLVTEGHSIGYVNSTGYSSGNHLHFGFKDSNGVYVDPMPFMKIRVPRWIGYKKHPQKDLPLPLPDIDTYNKLIRGELKLPDIYQFEDHEFTFPLDRPVY